MGLPGNGRRQRFKRGIYYLKVRRFVLVALSVELGKLKSSDHKLAAEGSPKPSTQQKAGP